MRTILIASNNRGKVAEMQALLEPFLRTSGIELRLPSDFGVACWSVDETGDTFVQNAVLKASTLASMTGMTTLGEDSGLCVDALGGAPGVRSARWHPGSDNDRNVALLRLIEGIPASRRSARFVSSVALCRGHDWPSFGPQDLLVTEGFCEGEIAVEPAGSEGFGYDPIFLLPAMGVTFAQLGLSDKNRLSHRAKALRALAENLQSTVRSFGVTDSGGAV